MLFNINATGKSGKEGYLLCALQKREYVEMALNLALSIRLKDKRPVCLLTNDEMPLEPDHRRFFDITKRISREDYDFAGKSTTVKLLLHKYTPFERSMYIDADCLLIKNDISSFWRYLRRYHFTSLSRHLIHKGEFLDKIPNIDLMLDRFNLPYTLWVNTGCIYFDRTEQSKKIIDKSLEFYSETNRDLFRVKSKCASNDRDYSLEEIIIGAALAFYGMNPIPSVCRTPFKLRQWYQSSGNKLDSADIDCFKGRCLFKKTGKQAEFPTIAHFGGLEPREIYLREVAKLRDYFKCKPYSVSGG